LLLYSCEVTFLCKDIELPPSGVSSFICHWVYDTTSKCLWWITTRSCTDVSFFSINSKAELCYAPGCHSDLAWSGGRWLLLLRTPSHRVVARRLVSSSVARVYYHASPSHDKRRYVCHLEPLNELPDCTTSQKRKLHHPVKNLEHNVRERNFWFDGV
jgi:hypothetical protein